MTINEIKSKVGELNSAWEEFKHTNNKRLEELEHKGSADPMLQNKLDRLNDVMDSTNKKLEMMEIRQKRPNIMEYKTGHEDRAYKKAFDEFLRFGDNEKLRRMQTKAVAVQNYDDIGIVGQNSGTNLIRPPMAEYIDLYSKDTEPMFDLVTKNYSTRAKVNFITDTDSFHAQWNASGTVIDKGGTAFNTPNDIEQFISKSVEKAMLFCNIRVNINVINDPIIDLEQFLVDAVARAFARARTKGILFGDGSTVTDKIPMKGLNQYVPNAAVGNPYPAVQVSGEADSAGNKHKKGIDSITYENVLALYYSLDDQYVKNASFVMSKQALTKVRTLKHGTTGNYLWSPSSAAIPQDTILGVPVSRVEDMDDDANKTIKAQGGGNAADILMYLGDFKRAYYLTLNPGIEIIRDPYSAQPSVNFLISQFTGGDMIDQKSFAAMISQKGS